MEDKEIFHQIKNVLRIVKGEKIVVCDGKGMEAECEVENFDKDRLNLKIIETRENINESKRNITLYLSILKKENFELAVQKAVEVGVKEITPIITERTVKLGLKTERLLKIIREATEQSDRTILPKLNEPLDFPKALSLALLNGQVFFFDSSGVIHDSLLRQEASGGQAKFMTHNSGTSSVFIGPEGGWTEKEITLAKNSGADIVSLGVTTLRAETAAIVSTYLVARS